jgi:hypothetical protein
MNIKSSSFDAPMMNEKKKTKVAQQNVLIISQLVKRENRDVVKCPRALERVLNRYAVWSFFLKQPNGKFLEKGRSKDAKISKKCGHITTSFILFYYQEHQTTQTRGP